MHVLSWPVVVIGGLCRCGWSFVVGCVDCALLCCLRGGCWLKKPHHKDGTLEVFTLPHEFWRNLQDSDRNLRIPWNSNRIHLAGASAILVFHSMEFPMETDGIHQNHLESVGIHWNSHTIGNMGIPMDSNRFQQIPIDSNVCLCYYYNIKKST